MEKFIVFIIISKWPFWRNYNGRCTFLSSWYYHSIVYLELKAATSTRSNFLSHLSNVEREMGDLLRRWRQCMTSQCDEIVVFHKNALNAMLIIYWFIDNDIIILRLCNQRTTIGIPNNVGVRMATFEWRYKRPEKWKKSRMFLWISGVCNANSNNRFCCANNGKNQWWRIH